MNLLLHDLDDARADRFCRAAVALGHTVARLPEDGAEFDALLAGASAAIIARAREFAPGVPILAIGRTLPGDIAALFAAGASDLAETEDELPLRLAAVVARGAMGISANQAGARLGNIVDHVSSAILTVSAEAGILFANRAASELSGVPLDRILAAPPTPLVAPESAAQLQALCHRALAGEAVHQRLLMVRLHDGRERALRCSMVPITESGRVTAVVVTADDVTDHLAAQRERDLLARIVESSEDSIITRDLDGRVVSWNAGAERMYGYAAGEVLGQVVDPAFLDVDDGDDPMDYRRGLETYPGRRRRVRRRRKDGSIVEVEVHVFPVADATGATIRYAGVSQDITERTRNEEEIARLAAIVESSQDAIVSVSPDGLIQSWNRGAETLYGYPREDVLGRHPRFLDLPGEGELERLLAQEDAEWPALSGLQTRHVASDGRVLDISLSLFPVRDGQNRVISIAGIGRDVSDQNRAQTALRRREQEFKALAANSPDVIFRFDTHGTCVYANPAAAALAKRDAAWFAGRSTEAMAVPTEPDLRASIAAVLASGHERSIDVRIDVPGTPRWFDIRFVPELDPRGETESVLLIGRDISARRLAQQALRESEEMLAMTYGSTPVGIAVLDAEGRFLRLNRAAASIIGYEPGELAGKAFAPLIVESDRARMAADYRGMINADEAPAPLSEAWRILHRDGSERLVSATWARFEGPGAGRFSVITVADITEQRAAEEELRRAQELLREAVTSGPVVLFTVGADGIVTMAEGNATNTTGATPADTVGLHIRQVYRGNADAMAAVDSAFAGERASFEWCIGEHWYDIHVAPMRSRRDQITGVMGVATDVTERRAADEARRKADAFYRAVVEGTSDALYVAERGQDGQFRCVVVNAAYEAMLDRPAAQVLGKTALEGIGDRRLADRVVARWQEAIDTRRPVHWELATPGGGAAFGQVTALFDADGECRLIVGSLRDITPVRRAEQARTLAEGRLQAVIESAPLIVFALDANWRITVLEGNGLAAIETDAADYLGADAHSFDYIPGLVDALEHAYAGEPTHIAIAYGQARVEVDLAPVRDHNGRVNGVVGVGVDVTERHRAEEARELAEERLRTVAANAPVVLWAIDANGIYTLCEGSVLESRGLSSDDLVGTSILERYAGNEPVVGQITAGLRGEESSLVAQVGEHTWFETRVVPLLGVHGVVDGLIGVSVDVTQRLVAERGMLQAQKLESLGVLAGGIAHDFNNLLVGILGNAGLALAELPATSPARPTIEAIATAGQRAAELARQMLAYSGRGRFVIQRLDLNEVVAEMLHLLRASVGKGVELRCDLSDRLPRVEADATQLRQVLMNLVVNGSDAIGAGPGVVRVTTGVRHVTRDSLSQAHLAPELPEGDYVAIEVADSGAGMDEETIARIFDPFFTTKFTGRGLGLAAVLGIVRGHRGAITVTSDPGEGSVFTLLLPVADDPVGEANALPAAAAPWRGAGSILVVDDEETVRVVTSRAVETFGFRALQAHDGLAGLEMFKQHANEIACVLLDMTMPRMNGEEAFHAIRQVDPEAVIVLMSGYNEQEATSCFMGETLHGFIQKPYELATLREMLRKVTTHAEDCAP